MLLPIYNKKTPRIIAQVTICWWSNSFLELMDQKKEAFINAGAVWKVSVSVFDAMTETIRNQAEGRKVLKPTDSKCITLQTICIFMEKDMLNTEGKATSVVCMFIQHLVICGWKL